MNTIAPASPDATAAPAFTGSGLIEGRSWFPREGKEIRFYDLEAGAPLPLGHPGAYEAHPDVIDAVNTALLLNKPLLLTGRPGTGKTDLAERIAYELDLGWVLRFEAQSLSEAGDLFYRFDYVAHMVAGKLAEAGQVPVDSAAPIHFVRLGPLGHAILRSAPEEALKLPGLPLGAAAPQRSVVLIDEIDKASRDFPNDLLNGIDRMSFKVREVMNMDIAGAGRDTPLHPIVIITSNSERDLPDPFLRRCVYVDIPDPKREQLARIVKKRVFGEQTLANAGADGLPPLYSRLLTAFVDDIRDDAALRYRPGTTELLNLVEAAVKRQPKERLGAVDAEALAIIEQAIAAMAKHREDREAVLAVLRQHLGAPRRPAAAS